MKYNILILIFLVSLLNIQVVVAAENEYGIVKAWFNGENATVHNVKLKIGEPAEVRVEVISKVNGNIYIKLKEPGITRSFDVLSGPSKFDEVIYNTKILSGWSKTYTWTIAPNGNWKDGNAPINLFVQIYQDKDDKIIQFTIANPYILDEQYSGAAPTPGKTTETIGTPSSTGEPPKSTPFLSALMAVAVMFAAWRRHKGG